MTDAEALALESTIDLDELMQRAAQLRDGARVEIQFQDGWIGATAGKLMGDSR